MGRIIPYIVENKKCLKPPPSHQTITVWNPQPAWLYPSFPDGCDTLRYTHRQARQAAFDQLPATIQQAVEEFVVLGRWHRPGIGFIYIYALFDILCLSWENSLIMFDIIRVHDILHSCCHANSRWLEAKPHAHPLCFASCVVLRNIFFLWCLLTRNGGFLK